MASQEHLGLSTFIKEVHTSLRNRSKEIGYKLAWQEHCNNLNHLNKYSVAMKQLATEHWDVNNSKDNSKAFSRIHWVYVYCINYFLCKKIFLQRTKEENILMTLAQTKGNISRNLCDNNFEFLNLLDVGSCYNPFVKYNDFFRVTAIDIAPASDDVYKCDFIHVDIDDNVLIENNTVKQLQRQSFHVIVFSLLLEYLPSPEQRLICCEKAYELLRFEGILIIITPDSKHVGANAKYMKSWRYVLSLMGFARIKYEKLPYLHCMVFRKSINKTVPERWAKLNEKQDLYNKLYIHQDFQENPNKVNNTSSVDQDNNNYFSELPFCI